ncbi:non-hydrolyzing UDP-N-acetylglucosamine 2-epimerase [Anaerosalibacter massiliensis]|uniref:non-hydrolyzing UDP-N-acetylglucosamine 2-epimerase n=1 Tax=Anaerosalibacter massiliensis TaxID=1347392 RepID=UPI0005B25F1D|nr:UDP-N-acetylglucosamine 2-epimerase (non-hydrolyzing) [Anaerosalibacter massiliensis]
MTKIKVLTIFGTRPEAIKMAPLVKELEKESKMESYVCVTAQHREMLDQVLEIFDIEPDYDLDIMQQKQNLTTITINALKGLSKVISKLKPDIVLVHGDTSTTFVGALAAFYNEVSVGHVEAGLRTYDKYSPYPEEMNRVLTGNIAEMHFAPTIKNKQNLIKENITKGIYITGNTVIDAINHTVKPEYVFKNPQLRDIDFSNGKYILMTAHRRENLGKPLENICRAVKRLVQDFANLNIIYPVHLNPKVRGIVNSILGETERIHLIDPVDVQDMHNLMERCYMVMSDSGGLQEEAPSLGKPVLVLRTETERPEAIEAGTVKLAGVIEDDIYNIASELLINKNLYQAMAKAVNPYGDGKASKRIVKAILHRFELGESPEEFDV